VAVVLLLAPTLLFAQSTWDWNVIVAAGKAERQIGDGPPKSIAREDRIGAGQSVATGADGRVVLERGKTLITIAPNSRIELPAGKIDILKTLIIQTLGTLLFKVERRPQQKFEVRTPYLVAVVKGTTFTVNVNAQGGAVHVVEGAVQVAL
jgi:hypothetical protein